MTQVIPKWFKQTDIWVIPENWGVASFDDVAEVVWWGTPSTKNIWYFGWDIAWITPKDLSWYSNKYISKWERNITQEWLKNSSAKLMPKWTVLLTSRAPVWYVAIAENDIATNQWFKSLVCNNEKIHNYFMYYYLKINKDYLEWHASWSTFKELSGWTLKNLKLPLPQLPEQKAIAEILSSLDDKIELLEKQNKTLENIGQALFKSWFIDFEGFENDLVESKMGMIPRGWKFESAENIVDFTRWIEPWSKNYLLSRNSDSLNFIRVADLLWNEITTFVLKDIIKNKTCKKDDILISFDWTVWRIAFWLEWGYSTWIRKLESKLLTNWFMYFLFNSEWMQNTILKYAKWTTILHAWESIKYMNIIIPDENKLDKINVIFSNLFIKMLNNKSKIQTTSNLRDSLLPRLMNGKVRVLDF